MQLGGKVPAKENKKYARWSQQPSDIEWIYDLRCAAQP